MTELAQIHVGDTPRFRAWIKDEDGDAVDISSAVTKQIKLKKPRGAIRTVAKNAEFITDGNDGGLYYDAVTADMDVEGNWQSQGYVKLASGKEYHSNIEIFTVYSNL